MNAPLHLRRASFLAARSVLCAIAAAFLLAGCQATPRVEPSSGAQQATAPTPPSEPVGSPAARTAPTAAERAQAQELARSALSQLEKGEETLAREEFERALALDPENELARRLKQEVAADPQGEWGSTYFRYQVQAGDRLSDIAQRCLGDKFRFYSLARYNGMPDSRKLAAGQQLKIPGTNRNCVRSAEAAAKPAVAPEAERAVPATPRREAERAATLAAELQRKGDLDGAYRAYGEAVRIDPGYADAIRQRDTLRGELLRRHEREANAAFQRQDLSRSIAEWDKVLVLDPDNERARLNRSRALDLQQRLQAIPGKK